MSASFLCAWTGCRELVRGVYCFDHREAFAERERALRAARAESMRRRWAEDHDGMLERLRAGRGKG